MDQTVRQLKLKTGSAQRLLKEYLSYYKEEVAEKERYEKMKNEGVEESRLRQQQQVCEETSQMIPYCRNKLEASANDLKKLVESCTSDEEQQLEEYLAAQKLINEIAEQLQN